MIRQNKTIHQMVGFNWVNAFEKQNKTIERMAGLNWVNVFEKQNKTVERMAGLNWVNVFEKQNKTIEQMAGLNWVNVFEKQNKSIQQMAGLNWVKAFEKQNKTIEQMAGLKQINIFEKQLDIMQEFIKANSRSTQNLHSVFNCITEEYLDEYKIEEPNIKEEIFAITNQLFEVEPCLKSLTPKQKELFTIFIYPLILMLIPLLLSFITAKPSIINNNSNISNNTVSIVSTYYIVQEGFSKEFLNDYNMRIILIDNAIIRKKHDCSSSVIGRLPVGKVVCIIDKYKKWVKITWSNENEEYYCGWIQNYKLTTFK